MVLREETRDKNLKKEKKEKFPTHFLQLPAASPPETSSESSISLSMRVLIGSCPINVTAGEGNNLYSSGKALHQMLEHCCIQSVNYPTIFGGY